MAKGRHQVRRVRQQEIADQVGVSVSTVSRVLNNANGIRESVREDVLRAAARLGYDRKASGQTGIGHIGFFTVLSTIGSPNDPFHTDILKGAEAECRKQGARLSLITLEPEDLERGVLDRQRLQQVKDSDIDAALLLSIDDRALIDAVLALGIHTVGINIDDPFLPIDTYIPNNRSGAYFATKHLIGLGHRRILHVTNLKRATIRKRFEGYRAALSDADIEFSEELCLETGLGAGASEAALAEYLRGNPDFSAVFCANDHAAIGVLHALRDAGREVPREVSVIGFYDIPMAAFINPPLSTMRVQREELGAATVRRLIERSRLSNTTPIRVQIATQLVERETTGPGPALGL